MSDLGVSEFSRISLAEKIPEGTKYSGGDLRPSLVLQRNNVKIVPQTGTSATPAGQTVFRLTDTQSFLDLDTCMLNFKVDLQNAAGAHQDPATGNYIVPDDAMVALLRRVKLSINGILAEDILQNNTAFNASNYMTTSKKHYNCEQSIQMGSWKHADETFPVVSGSVNAITNLTFTGAPAAGANAISAQTGGDVASWAGNDAAAVDARALSFANYVKGQEGSLLAVSIPLAHLLGFFRQEKYLPLMALSQIEIECFWDEVANCCKGYGTTTGYKFVVSDLNIRADYLLMESSYVDAVQRLLRTEGMPYKLAYSTLSTQTDTKSGSAAVSQKNYIFSKSTPHLRSLMLVKRDNSHLNNIANYGNSSFARMNQDFARVAIGGYYYPQGDALRTTSECFQASRLAMGVPSTVDNHTVVDAVKYQGGNATDATADTQNGAFVMVFGFDKTPEEGLPLDGLSAVVSGGSINYICEDVGGAGVTINTTAFIEYSRQLVIENGQVAVVG